MANEKVFSVNEIQRHTEKGDLWLSIHGNVYDVSEFMEDHPGGADALLDQGGIDATPAFEDVGHSDDARGILAKYKLGRAEELPADARVSSGAYMKLEEKRTPYSIIFAPIAFVLILIFLLLR